MPRRKRTNKRRDDLTPFRDLLLTLGPVAGPEGEPDTGPSPYPVPGSEEWGALRACWQAHRDNLVGGEDQRRCWGWRVFENGDDPAKVSARLVRAD